MDSCSQRGTAISTSQGRILWTVTMITVMSYLFVASSAEFSPFAPVRVTPAILNTTAVLIGLLTVSVTRGMAEHSQFIVFGMVIIGPIITYGATLLTLWATLAGFAFLDLFLVGIAQRMFVYVITTGVLGFCSIMLGIMVNAFRS